MKLAAGDALAAKQDLQRALGLAHRNLGNQQLVVQVRGVITLYTLAPNPSIPLGQAHATQATNSWSCRCGVSSVFRPCPQTLASGLTCGARWAWRTAT